MTQDWYAGKYVESLRDRFHGLNDWVIICKCVVGEDAGGGYRTVGGIVIDSISADTTNFVELVAVGAGCKLFKPHACRWMGGVLKRKAGEIVWSMELSKDMQHLDGPYWACREHVLQPVLIRAGGAKACVALGDWVLVRTCANDNGGIERASEYEDADLRGDVVNIGEDCRQVRIGDTVQLPGQHRQMKLGGEKVAVLREGEVLGVWRQD